ncbi:MAG: pyridoxal phosphate-dependent aminotransferase [Thiohalospira sp.]|uniref:pyridoxal phosphate-dependent aminotransferase n=1 Tax=Thiohalospira sp. TaxID=3080549 RepID=UPI003981872A
MDIELAERARRVKPSPTLAVTARAKALRAAGQDIIGLGAGEPDFDTPDNIKEAAMAAIRAGDTKYTAVDGTPALKEAIAAKFRRDNSLDYDLDQILVSAGGKQSFFNLCQALLNPGDEVVIPAPYWVSYPDIVRLAEGEARFVETTLDAGFKMTPDQLEAAITDNTRLVVINSPSNPTGVAYTRAELAALGSVLERHPRVLVATDDIYEHIRWEEGAFINIVNATPSLKERAVVLNGVSKAYSMTGWRIGYAAGPADLIAAMKTIQSQSTSNPASISQAAAVEALTGDQSCIETMVTAFRQRHDFVVEALGRLPGVRSLPGQGAFYCFPDMSEAIRGAGMADDVAFAEHLLTEAGVALVPGSAFGAPGCMRLSFATSLSNLEQAMERLAGVLQKG